MNAMQPLLLDILDTVKEDPINAESFLDRMVAEGVQLREAGAVGSDVLHKAVREDCGIFIKKCVDAGADINVQDSFGETPLYVACGHWYFGQRYLRKNMVELLIQCGAAPNRKTNDGMTALHNVAGNERVEEAKDIIKMLLPAGAHAKWKDDYGKTADDYASSDDIKKELLFGPHGWYELDLQQPPIYQLPRNPELLKKAIPLGLNINAYDPRDRSSLLWLVFDCIYLDKLELMEEIIDLLIQYGVDLDHGNKYGDTIVHKIARMENCPESLCKKIIGAAGVGVNAKNNVGQSALHMAINRFGMPNIFAIKLLLMYGKAEVNIQDHNENTPLHYAVSGGDGIPYKQAVSLLLCYGADFKKKNNIGATPYDTALYSVIANMLKDEESVRAAITSSEFYREILKK